MLDSINFPIVRRIEIRIHIHTFSYQNKLNKNLCHGGNELTGTNRYAYSVEETKVTWFN